VQVPSTDIPQQYQLWKNELDKVMTEVLLDGIFIGGEKVKNFEQQLADYLHIKQVIGCANGTDALQLALMACDLPKKSKIIVPAFTYIAPVEVIKFLGYEPVFCDVDPDTFNCTAETIEAVYSKDVKAILPVHLFGQCCDMGAISSFAEKNNCLVIEDNAQSIAANKNLSASRSIITTSFFPTKNLGGFGDGGAVIVNDDGLAQKIRTIANHGQSGKKYIHDTVGINSRLDVLQAAILQIKLKYLDECIAKRQQAASFYDDALSKIDGLRIPQKNGNHTYYLYTIKAEATHRDRLQQFLLEKNIPAVVYYPLPAYRQAAYLNEKVSLPNSEALCQTVLSLPMHTALDEKTLSYICESIQAYFKQ
jgi:dTDP-4-amino-4,6-dideoxygalactose transaminase